MFLVVRQAGELKSAVKEMEKLQGLPADVAQDWMRDAKVRVTADEVKSIARNVNGNINLTVPVSVNEAVTVIITVTVTVTVTDEVITVI